MNLSRIEGKTAGTERRRRCSSYVKALEGNVPTRWALAALVASAMLVLAAPQASAASPDAQSRSGAITPRVVGGTAAPAGAWPSIAAVFPGPYFCGGTLIAHRWVITAAHCVRFGTGTVSPSKVDFLIGGIRLNPSDGERREASYVFAHPDYSDSGSQGDLAVIRLSERSSKPVMRIISPAESAAWEPGDPAEVAGWGATAIYPNPDYPPEPPEFLPNGISNLLQEGGLQISSAATCSATYPGVDNDAIVCASGAPTTDSCNGDSGGPLQVETSPGVRRMVGLVSFGPGNGDCGGYPGGYTKLVTYRNWIGSYVVDWLDAADKLSFGARRVGRKTSKGLRFGNLSETRLTGHPDGYTIRGKGRRSFRYAGGCGGPLSYGESCKVTVRFRPTSKGKKVAYLRLYSSRGFMMKKVKLVGRGTR